MQGKTFFYSTINNYWKCLTRRQVDKKFFFCSGCVFFRDTKGCLKETKKFVLDIFEVKWGLINCQIVQHKAANEKQQQLEKSTKRISKYSKGSTESSNGSSTNSTSSTTSSTQTEANILEGHTARVGFSTVGRPKAAEQKQWQQQNQPKHQQRHRKQLQKWRKQQQKQQRRNPKGQMVVGRKGEPKISLSPPKISLSVLSLASSSRGISVVFEKLGGCLQNARLGSLGHRVKPRQPHQKTGKKHFSRQKEQKCKNNEDQIKVKFKEGKQKTKEAKKKQHKLSFLSFLFSPSSLRFFIVVSLKKLSVFLIFFWILVNIFLCPKEIFCPEKKSLCIHPKKKALHIKKNGIPEKN